MANMEKLGIEEAKKLRHASTLMGRESGSVYIVFHFEGEEFPWRLVNFYAYEKVWGKWKTREAMIAELANCYMFPKCMW